MKLVLNQPCLEPFEPAKDLKVFVASEDSSAAAQACVELERIGRDWKAEGRLIYSWWNFEVLAITVLKKLAASEAAAADIIIIAAHDGLALPAGVVDWIHQWLGMGKHQARALVALLFNSDTTKKKVSPGLCAQLKGVAELGRMEFFTKGDAGELGAALAQGPVPPPGNPPRRAAARAARIAGRSGNIPAAIVSPGKTTTTMDHENFNRSKTDCPPG